jgi:hypothetical protein
LSQSQHGIKHEFTSFPTLKDDKNNDQWYHTFTNIACAQDLGDILEPTYTLFTSADIDLFAKRQKFVNAVLEANVETAKGKQIIFKHEPVTPKRHMLSSRTTTLYFY